MTAWWVVGDTRDVTALIPDASVDLILTSPPFLALRSYLPAGHVDKHREIGSESTPAEFVDMLLGLTAEWRRILTPTGSLVVELGDTYSGSGGAGGDYAEDGLRDGQPKFKQATKNAQPDAKYGDGRDWEHERSHRARKRDTAYPGWPEPKSLCLIPELYRIGLVYGLNPLTGQPSPAGRFRGRNVIRWVRPNPPVGALGDKFRPATSDLVVACTAKDRWFDLDAVRTPGTEPGAVKTHSTKQHNPSQGWTSNNAEIHQNPNGAPPLDWWQIVPGGFSGAHYAVFPAELCVKPIEAMCPRRVCVSCSKPSRRVVGEATYTQTRNGKTPATLHMQDGSRRAEGVNQWATTGDTSVQRSAPTTGWSSCGCPGTDGLRLDGYHTGLGWRPGRVLDPFAGSGTVAAVASGHGRDSVGIDIDSRNADLARERVGMFLEPVTAADLADRLRDGAVEGVA